MGICSGFTSKPLIPRRDLNKSEIYTVLGRYQLINTTTPHTPKRHLLPEECARSASVFVCVVMASDDFGARRMTMLLRFCFVVECVNCFTDTSMSPEVNVFARAADAGLLSVADTGASTVAADDDGDNAAPG